MVKRLESKKCVVTGAGQGIGQAIAQAFHAEGATVFAIDRQADVLEGWATPLGMDVAALDVTDETAVADVAASHQDAAVLVNCVGMVLTDTVLTSSAADLERSFRVNVGSMATVIRAFLPGMRERRDGAIINIASVVSSSKGAPDRFSYGTTKAAVIGLSKSVARDFIGEGIRCNSISPGTVESPSLHQRMAAQGDFEAARQAFVSRQPMGRLGTPEEIAAIAVLLASDEARFMTGSDIIIDGGMTL